MKKQPSLLQVVLNRFGFFSREQFRTASAQTKAALVNRLTASWTQTTLSADAQSRTDLRILRARSRELRDNNNYSKKFAHMLKTNVLGDSGIHFRNKAKDLDRVQGGVLIPGKDDIFANKIIEEKFWQWGRKEYCTVTGKLCWGDVQSIVLETAAIDGESFVRKVRRKVRDNPFGFTLQILDAEQLDHEYNCMLPNGNEVRMGVELDEWHKPVGYWFMSHNPSDLYFFARPNPGTRFRIDASEMIHVFKSNKPDQTRGMPWMATCMDAMNMTRKYEESEAVAAAVAASRPAFLSPDQASTEYTGEKDENGNPQMDTEPGTIEQLPFKMNLLTPDWNHPNSGYGQFMKTSLRGIASGLGVSYNTLANDMESVNFASGKLGLEDERQKWKSDQAWFIDSFCEEVFREWLLMALTTQAVPLPISKFDKFNAPEFKGRTWDYVNPVQEVASKISQLNAGLTSQSRILAERGIDRDELLDEIAADRAAAEARDIVFTEVPTEDPMEKQAQLDAEAMGNQPAQKED